MLELLISLWLVQLAFTRQSASMVERTDTISDAYRITSDEKSNNGTASLDERHRHWIEYFAKVVLFVLIVAACVLLVIMSLYLAVCCYSWTRPSRVHKEISIEHLTSTELIPYVDVSPTPSSGSEHTPVEQG